MTVLEAVEMFELEMTNEIFHSMTDDVTKDSLIEALKSVKRTVLDTYESEKR